MNVCERETECIRQQQTLTRERKCVLECVRACLCTLGEWMDGRVGLQSVNEAKQAEGKKTGGRMNGTSKLLASHWTHFNSTEKTWILHEHTYTEFLLEFQNFSSQFSSLNLSFYDLCAVWVWWLTTDSLQLNVPNSVLYTQSLLIKETDNHIFLGISQMFFKSM